MAGLAALPSSPQIYYPCRVSWGLAGGTALQGHRYLLEVVAGNYEGRYPPSPDHETHLQDWISLSCCLSGLLE